MILFCDFFCYGKNGDENNKIWYNEPSSTQERMALMLLQRSEENIFNNTSAKIKTKSADFLTS